MTADNSGGGGLEIRRGALTDALRQLRDRGQLGDLLYLAEEIVRQGHPGLRRTRLERAVNGLGHVPDLDHPRHA